MILQWLLLITYWLLKSHKNSHVSNKSKTKSPSKCVILQNGII